MKHSQLFRNGIGMMARFKLRTALMALGIVISVAMLVVVRTYGAGAKQAMMDKMSRFFNPTNLMVLAGPNSLPGQEADGSTLTLEDLEAVVAASEEVVAWDPMQTIAGRTVQYRDKARPTIVYGHTERYPIVWNRDVSSGRPIEAEDVATSARVAILGYKTAEFLFGDDDPLGKQIQIGSVPFRVKGVLGPLGLDPHGTDRDDEIQVPITTMNRRLLNVSTIASAKLLLRDEADVAPVAERLRMVIRERHGIAEGERDDFLLITPELVNRMLARANRVFTVFLPRVAGIILLMAALVITIVMLMTIRERVAEIGLRKAVGATDDQIGRQFLVETLLITLTSGLFGLILGLAVVMVGSQLAGFPIVIAPSAFLLGLLAALAAGLLASVLPARRAARMSPVTALR